MFYVLSLYVYVKFPQRTDLNFADSYFSWRGGYFLRVVEKLGFQDGCFLRGLKLSVSRKVIALDWSGTLKARFITTSTEWTKVLPPPTPLPLCGALLTSTGWRSRSPSWIAMTLAIPTTPQPLSGEPIACFDTIQTCMMRRHWKVCGVFPFCETAYILFVNIKNNFNLLAYCPLQSKEPKQSNLREHTCMYTCMHTHKHPPTPTHTCTHTQSQ